MNQRFLRMLAVFCALGCGGSTAPDAGRDGSADAGRDGALDATADAALAFASCFDDLDPGMSFVQMQFFRTQDESIRLALATKPGDRPFVGETFPYDLIAFALDRAGDQVCVTESAALAYDFGHHNWNDIATAQVSGHQYQVHMMLSFGNNGSEWVDTLTIDEQESIPLIEDSCRSVPFDLNPCFSRERSDAPE